jgi:DNA repair protein RecN (Recombination protein N)
LRSLAAELADVAATVRDRGESIEDDPARLDAIRERRQRLHELRRKYGTAGPAADGQGGGAAGGTLADVIAYRDEVGRRLAALEGYEERAAELDRRRGQALAEVARLEAKVGKARRAAAPRLAEAVQANLADLAMARARVEVEVGEDDPGDQVRFLLAANAGSALLPLSKVASGGELARAMLALRLVLTAAPPCLVFDEVDAGIGGTAALAVGRALAALGADHQVLVVTHLPQVAAFADTQVTVVKAEDDGTTVVRARALGTDERIVELSRMLAGAPHSTATRAAAAELLQSAAAERGR